ncbi:MAG: FAD-binding oxidoreductase [Myxococcales bacterium]|nr:FAD-binding oxidoreductase [Polyangiaceae bacterium]MDW8251966.1 FAD-binding oxidoreductase [Myxococcales bacterium]
MRSKAEVVVVGGGIMGLAIAYNLARHHGVREITVVEKSYLCGGASGRNGGGVRAQWSSGVNVRLMRESIALCEDFAREMRINVWFRQGGYLFLARSEEKRRALEASVAVQREEGLKTRMLGPAEAKKIVPELSVEGVVAASYNPTDGVVFPWPFVWGYAEGARRLGVEIATHTEVTGFRTKGPRIEAVETNRGVIETGAVVNAAGAWSPQVAKMLGVDLPNRPHRHEICSTEPLKPWLQPLVADLGNGLYFSQSMRGEIVGGISNEQVPPGLNMDSSSEFLRRYAKALTELVPRLGQVKVLRQWAGCYDLTPDANPIVGEVDSVERFYQASGFMGHGFMMAPVIGKRLARLIATGEEDPLFSQWNLRRFREGRLLSEAMIIG